MANTVGDVIRVTGTFAVDDVNTDPTTIVFKYATPSGTITTLTSGTDAEVVKSATGVYYVDITTTQHGVYRTEWTGTGTVRAADGVEFTVDAPTVAL